MRRFFARLRSEKPDPRNPHGIRLFWPSFVFAPVLVSSADGASKNPLTIGLCGLLVISVLLSNSPVLDVVSLCGKKYIKKAPAVKPGGFLLLIHTASDLRLTGAGHSINPACTLL